MPRPPRGARLVTCTLWTRETYGAEVMWHERVPWHERQKRSTRMTDTAVSVGAAPPHSLDGPPPLPEFSIVPVRGLPIVAALLIGLIVAIASNSLWALTF